MLLHFFTKQDAQNLTTGSCTELQVGEFISQDIHTWYLDQAFILRNWIQIFNVASHKL